MYIPMKWGGGGGGRDVHIDTQTDLVKKNQVHMYMYIQQSTNNVIKRDTSKHK